MNFLPVRVETSSKMATYCMKIKQEAIGVADVVDALDGATLTGETLTTSATPTVTELEACIGVLGGKINKILDILDQGQ